jgi:hypothetical protein
MILKELMNSDTRSLNSTIKTPTSSGQIKREHLVGYQAESPNKAACGELKRV